MALAVVSSTLDSAKSVEYTLHMMELSEIFEFWGKGPQGSCWPRSIDVAPPQPDIATLIVGVRRCGKTTFLHQLQNKWNLEQNQCFYVNFEDPRLAQNLNTGLLDDIHEQARTHCPQKARYFFLDEIQIVDHWQKWIRQRVDKPSAAEFFVLSGSNASLLSGELSSVLTGRHRQMTLFPFSFAEFFKIFPQCSLEDYLNKGGFPRALQDDAPSDLLKQYFLDITERDIRERVKAKSSLPLQILIKCVFESVGSEISLRRLAGITNLSVDTASLYLEAAEKAFLVFACPYFSYSERQVQNRNKKYYAVDPALRHAIINTGGKDLGKDFENIVYLELKRKYGDVFYWSGSGKVDFVVHTPAGILPIQVSVDQPKPRHEDALTEFYQKHPLALESRTITTANFSQVIKSI